MIRLMNLLWFRKLISLALLFCKECTHNSPELRVLRRSWLCLGLIISKAASERDFMVIKPVVGNRLPTIILDNKKIPPCSISPVFASFRWQFRWHI